MPIPGGPRPGHVVPRSFEDVVARLGPGVTAVAAAPGTPARTVTGVTLGSRTVRPGDLYAALPGSRSHGAAYAGHACDAGAVAILTDAEGAERARATRLPVVRTSGKPPVGGIGAGGGARTPTTFVTGT